MRLLTFILVFLVSTQIFATPTTDGLHLDWLDKTINPTSNYFTYANGNWQRKNPIPKAYARWGTFDVLHEQNQLIIKQILENLTTTTQTEDSIEQKVGDFYYSGMNETAINKAGITPLNEEFKYIDAIQSQNDLLKTIAHLQMIGVDVPFAFGQMQDFKDSTQVIGAAFQSGLGLPDRDYYLKQDAKFKNLRTAYQEHITKMFELMGENKNSSHTAAQTIMKMETQFAKASMSRIELRDPHAVYHFMDIAKLNSITPNFSWKQYFTEIGHPEITHINLATPNFFTQLNKDFKTISLNDWKVYLRWHVVHQFAPYLSNAFVNENFHMVSKLSGAKELLPRWKRVVNTEDSALGFAIGKLFVEKTFPPEAKKTASELIAQIRVALKKDLENLPWMTNETRKAAMQKLDLMEDRVGYPNKWRDYSALKIDRGPYVLNVIRANEFESKRTLDKIGKPVDKEEWDMAPQTVNAYYDPSMNRLNIPAGILQPPFFDPNAPAAVNYGAIGFVIGHEMTHGFDDEGAQFDGKGNLKNWWTEQDLKKFKTITQAIADQFSKYTVNGNTHVQGKLVMGEATADIGGLTLAYNAFHSSDAFKTAKTIQGYSPDQQFFLGAAHVWASNIRPEEAQRLAVIDPHPPAKERVNGTLANMEPFRLAYNASRKNIGKGSTIW